MAISYYDFLTLNLLLEQWVIRDVRYYYSVGCQLHVEELIEADMVIVLFKNE